MNEKEIEIGMKSFAIIEKCRFDLLALCEGQPTSMILAVLTASADSLLETADEIRDWASETKDSLDLLRDAFEETLK